ncbi:MAG TPA: acyltransferase [Candidatus Bathyarchaeia archaeon]|nr:acyltransferase [Candidatus Bathyarchaeia archaeon]
MKQALKSVLHGLFLVLALPAAAVAGFGRIPATFTISAHGAAMVPGILGDYFRIAFYKLTLKQCSLYSRVSFGSFFAHSDAALGRGVYIGSYCILGRCSIGDRTQIASQVQVLSGRRQHSRDSLGQITGAEEGEFEWIDIGADCWIGASSIIMAPIGSGSTIGAGSVVVRPLAAQVVAVGNPARVIKENSPQYEGSGVTK